jgi:hypothetical protein
MGVLSSVIGDYRNLQNGYAGPQSPGRTPLLLRAARAVLPLPHTRRDGPIWRV